MCLVRLKCDNVESCVKLGTISKKDAYNDIKKIVPGIAAHLNCKELSFAKVNGKKWISGTIVVYQIDYPEPEFCIVQKIYTVNTHVFIYAKKLTTLEFDDYYHAYRIDDSPFESDKVFINLKDLPEVEPCVIHTNSSGTFVATRYDL